MNATSNLIHNLELRLSQLRGEREAAEAEVRAIQKGIGGLAALHERIANLVKAIDAADTLLLHDQADCQPSRIKAVRKRRWSSPFRSDDIGRTALTVLRERGGWLRPLNVSKIMLESINHDPNDRKTREKLTNNGEAMTIGDVGIDVARRHVTRDGEPVHLTPKEFAVLAELARTPDRVLSPAHLLRTMAISRLLVFHAMIVRALPKLLVLRVVLKLHYNCPISYRTSAGLV